MNSVAGMGEAKGDFFQGGRGEGIWGEEKGGVGTWGRLTSQIE